MMKGKTWLFLIGSVFVAGAVAAVIWVYDSAAAQPGLSGIVKANGRIEVRQVRVSSATGGRVLDLLVREGYVVHAADTIAFLDDRRQRAAVAALEASVSAANHGAAAAERRALALEDQTTMARIEALRYRRLFERDAASRQAAERAEATLAQLEDELAAAHAAHDLAIEQARLGRAQLEGARAELDETIVTAPVHGVVSDILVRQGEVAAPGVPIVTVRRTGDVVLRVYLPLLDAERVQVGAPARIHVEAFPDRVFEGVVETIASDAEFTPRDIHMPDERTTLVYEVGLGIRDPGGVLKDGFPADALIRWDDTVPWPEQEPS